MKHCKRTLAWMLALCLICGFLPVGALAAEDTAPTTNLTTTGSPFQKGTGESTSFRIPALVTLSDGTLVAAADARWNTTYDGGGLDTMVALSRDNGATWTHSFANYLGDNGNVYNGTDSTCFIDPALAVRTTASGDTIYMLCDLYPYGIALNGSGNTAPSTDTGFTTEGYLKLDYNGQGTFAYYLKDGKIYSAANDGVISNYSVDEHFNITSTAYNVDTNLFYSDSPFKVARTGYLYLTQSTDGGASWSAPQLLNRKTTGEMVCLVGPGRGLVTESGTIVFPVYSYNGSESSQRLSFLYSTDGTSWARSDSLPYSWASESVAIELDANNLRFFFRNGSTNLMYVDYNWNTGWGTPQSTGLAVNSNCQISAIRLDQTIDSEPVILVSCPGGPAGGSNQSSASYRLNGKIFLFTLGDHNSLNYKKTLSVPSVNSANHFMYSCMTALTDENGAETGDIAILYEDKESGWGVDQYYQMSYQTYDVEEAFGVTFSNATVDPDAIPVTLNIGESRTYTDTTGNHANSITQTPDTAIATMTVSGTPAQQAGVSTTKTTVLEDGATYILRVYNTSYALSSDTGRGDWGTQTLAFQYNALTVNTKHMWTLEAADGGYKLKNANGYLNLGAPAAGKQGSNAAYLNTTGEVFTLLSTSTGWTVMNPSGQYINALGGLNYYYSAGGWNEGGTRFDLYKVNEETAASTTITFQGKQAGTTTATVGSTTYNITVTADVSNVIDVELSVGEQYQRTDPTGDYENSITLAPDPAIVTMTVDGISVEGEFTKEALTTLSAGDTFYIEVSEGVYLTADAGTTTNLSKAELWEAYKAYTSYCTVRNTSDYYLGVGYDMVPYTSQSTLYLKMSSGLLVGYYSAAPAGTPVKITSTESKHETNITFEGKKAGFTTAIIGDTQYNITVSQNLDTEDIELELGETFTFTDTTGNYSDSISQQPNSTYASMTVSAPTSDTTKVTFLGIAEGATSAIVGNTQYNITVVPPEVDDEVIHSATDIWILDPEVQRQRYASLIGLNQDLYTNDSWDVYESARQAAYKQSVEVSNALYGTQEQAEAALAELTALIDALETAKENLVDAKTISIRYTLDTVDGAIVDIREYKIPAGETTLSLPHTIVRNDITYSVTTPDLTLGVDTTIIVPVTKLGKVGGGFVASGDINAGTHNGVPQILDLVDDTGTVAKKINKITTTVGTGYDLNLATDTTGKTVEWSSEHDSIASVDQNGMVTATGEGTTRITAVVKDADGNVVEANTIPVTVYPKGTGERKTAIYINNLAGSTVWCVFNADTENYGFQVENGELIYGQFDTTVSDGTKTTAVSFFSNPDDASALVYMKSTGSDDQYFLLHDDDGNLYDGAGSNSPDAAYFVSGTTRGAGYWQAMGLNNNQSPNWNVIKDMVQWSIDLGCDGGLGFTRRQNEGAMASSLDFVSDAMPRIEKTVDGVLPTSRKEADYRRYVENMVAAVDELVYFKITITQEIPTAWLPADAAKGIEAETVGAITYSNALVTDTILPGAYLYTKELDQLDGKWDGEIAEDYRTQTDDITDELNAPWTQEQKTAGLRSFEYYLVYEIQDSDIPKFWIDNIAGMSYNYKSSYSTGAQAGAADAEAHITVVGSAIDEVVIDFGQTVTYTGLENGQMKGVYVDGENDVPGITRCKATARYGDVSVTRTPQKDADGAPLKDPQGDILYSYTVTYTPHSILQEPDAVALYGIGENNQEKVINGFLVYPATTVYYEEGFLLNDASTWDASNAATATTEQALELLGKSQFDEHGMLTHKISDKHHPYGFDPLYEQAGYTHGNSYASANTVGQTTTFTFTGTGFDLYANCTGNTGYISALVKNSAGKYVKMYMVNTVVKGGETAATQGQTGDAFHLPVVSADLGAHDTYTVTLTKIMDARPVILDGIRIHNTVADSSVYGIDLEDNPEFYPLRDYVLSAVDIHAVAGELYGTDWLNRESIRIGELAEQVYGTIGTDSEKPAAIITSTEDIYGDGATAQDLLQNGPKNELFLYPGQTLTFRVTTNRAMQIGLKAPRAATSYTLQYAVGSTVTSVATNASLKTSVDMFYALDNPIGTETTYTVSIANTGSDILSVTDLKICDDPNAVFEPLTVADIELVLDASLGSTESGDPEKFNIAFTQVALGNALDIRFAFAASAQADWTSCYAVATKTYADGRDDQTVTVPASQWKRATINGTQHYYFSFSSISAKEMADDICVTIYNADGEAISNRYTDSIRSYCMRILDNQNEETRTLLVDMLNYGSAAQTYYGYNTSDLANSLLSETQKTWGTKNVKPCTDIRVKGVNYLGIRLELGSRIVMQFAFRDLTADMTAEVTFTNHNGVEVTQTVTPVMTNDAGLVIAVDQIVAADFRQRVTVTVYDADGSVHGSATDSIESYLARMDIANELYASIMKFSDAAYAYLH